MEGRPHDCGLPEVTDCGLLCIRICPAHADTAGAGAEELHTIASRGAALQDFPQSPYEVAQTLIQAGFVDSVRGRRGGLKLAKEPAKSISARWFAPPRQLCLGRMYEPRTKRVRRHDRLRPPPAARRRTERISQRPRPLHAWRSRAESRSLEPYAAVARRQRVGPALIGDAVRLPPIQ